ncbi:MAG: PRTRC system protein A [Sulfuritalea sp.]|nr:PRTRC system protein A [Sulfuritalea sp.]
MSIDLRDSALQASCPTVMVPRFGTFQPLQEPGHRFLSAADGLWIEAYRPWVYIRQPLALQKTVAMPYGRVTREIDLSFGKIPRGLFDEFAVLAREHLPNECAACIVWSEHNGFELRPLGSIKALHGFVKYERPIVADGEHLIIDLHSHGLYPAFFSGRDDRDDRGEVKITGVLGNLDQETYSLEVRLCVQGLFITLPAG